MPEAITTLTELLGEPPPAAVAALPDATLDQLIEHIRTAQQRQAMLIADATDTAVKGVPLPVRGIVKRALLG